MTNNNWCNICRPSINGLFVAISDNDQIKTAHTSAAEKRRNNIMSTQTYYTKEINEEMQLLKFINTAVQQYFQAQIGLGEEFTLKIGTWPSTDRKANKLRFKGRLLCSGEYFNTKYSIYQMPLGSIVVHWHHLRHTPEEADYTLLDKLPGAGEWIVNGKFGGTEKIPGALLQNATKESVKPWIN